VLYLTPQQNYFRNLTSELDAIENGAKVMQVGTDPYNLTRRQPNMESGSILASAEGVRFGQMRRY
jgi:hypothetical protein